MLSEQKRNIFINKKCFIKNFKEKQKRLNQTEITPNRIEQDMNNYASKESNINTSVDS